MKRVTEGHALNCMWICVGYLTLDIVRVRVSGRVRDHVRDRVWYHVGNRVAERVRARIGEYEVEP